MENKPFFKNIPIYITIGTLIIGSISAFVKLSISAENATTRAENLSQQVEIIKDKNRDLDKELQVSKTNQENIKEEVKKTGEKVDKVIDLLLKMQSK